MKLQEFKERYPQYAEVPDTDLAQALHKKYYSNVPFDDFAKAIDLPQPGLLQKAGKAWGEALGYQDKPEYEGEVEGWEWLPEQTSRALQGTKYVGAKALQNIYQAGEDVLRLPQRTFETMGLPLESVKRLADVYHQYLVKPLEDIKYDPQTMPEYGAVRDVEIPAQVMSEVGKYMLGAKTFGGMSRAMGTIGAGRGYREGGPVEALEEGAKGVMLANVLKGAQLMPKAMGVPTTGAIFGGQAALEGAEPDEVLIQTLVGMGLALPGQGPTWAEFKKANIIEPAQKFWDSDTIRRFRIRERGLEPLKVTKKFPGEPGLTPEAVVNRIMAEEGISEGEAIAKAARRYPEIFEWAMGKRARGEQARPAEPTEPITPEPPPIREAMKPGQGFVMRGAPEEVLRSFSPEMAKEIRARKTPALPPGQGFIRRPITKRRPSTQIPEQEYDYMPMWPNYPGVEIEYKPILSGSGQPYKSRTAAITALMKRGYNPKEYGPVSVEGGWGFQKGAARAVPKAPLKEVSKRTGPQNLVTRILASGGIKLGKDFNITESRQFPDLNRVIRQKTGVAVDDMAMTLRDEGYPVESDDDLVALLESGNARNIYAQEVQEERIASDLKKMAPEEEAAIIAEMRGKGMPFQADKDTPASKITDETYINDETMGQIKDRVLAGNEGIAEELRTIGEEHGKQAVEDWLNPSKMMGRLNKELVEQGLSRQERQARLKRPIAEYEEIYQNVLKDMPGPPEREYFIGEKKAGYGEEVAAYGSKEKANEVINKAVETISTGRDLYEYKPGAEKGRPAKSWKYETSTITSELKNKKRVDFTGRTVKGRREIVELFQVYRSPGMESFHVIYLDKDGKILAHTALSSGVVSSVTISPKTRYKIQSAAERLNADKVVFLHNHPSGKFEFSRGDLQMAKALQEQFGDKFGSFMVIDHGKFSYITDRGLGPGTYAEAGIIEGVNYTPASVATDWTLLKGPKLSSPKQTANLGHQLIYNKDHATLVYLDASNRVNGWSIHSNKILKSGKFQSIVRQGLRAHDAHGVVLLSDNKTEINKFATEPGIAPFLYDAIYVEKGKPAGHVSYREAERFRSWGAALPSIVDKGDRIAHTLFEPKSEYRTDAEEVLKENKADPEDAEMAFEHPDIEDIGKLRKALNKFSKDLSGGDISLLHQAFKLPHWAAKDPRFKPIYEVMRQRDKDRNYIRNTFLAELEPFLNLKGKSYKKVDNALWRGDELESELTEQGKAKLTKEERAGYQAVRNVLNYIRDEDLPDLMRQLEHTESEIEEYRRKIGRIKGYMPHMREGRYFIKVGKGEETQYREHFGDPLATLTRGKVSIKAKLKERKLAKQFPEYKDQIYAGRNERMPEEIFFQISPEAMEQIIRVAVEKAGAPKAVAEALKKASAEVIMQRGFMAHATKRHGIPGFDKGNSKDTLIRYLSGYAGFKSKMIASRKLSSALGKIDARKNPRLYKYATKYSRDLMENLDSLDHAVDMFRGFLFRKYLSGVVKSAALQLTQNYISAIPRLTVETKWADAKIQAEMVKAGADIVQDLYAKGVRKVGLTKKPFTPAKHKRMSPDEIRQMTKSRNNGIIADDYTQELMGAALGRFGSKIRMIDNALRFLFSRMEIYNRETTWLASYRIAKSEKGLTEDQGGKWAEEIVEDTHFVYGKSNLPPVTRGHPVFKVTRGGYAFRSFPHNLLSMYRETAPKEKGKYALAKALMYLMAFAGVAGIPFYKDFEHAYQYLSGINIRSEIVKTAGKWKNFFLYGLPGLFGIDLTGSISTEAPTELKELPGAAGEVIYDVGRMTKDIESRDLRRALEDTPITPSVIKYILAAQRLRKRGQTARSGDVILDDEGKPIKLTAKEAWIKSLGFQPVKLSEGYRKYEARGATKRYWDKKKKTQTNRIINAINRYGADSKQYQNAIAEAQKLNEKLPEFIAPITPLAIIERIQQRQSQREQALRKAVQ